MSDDRKIFQEVARAYDLPAFLRRAHEVEAAWQLLVTQCQSERRRLLQIPRLRLATLTAASDRWTSLLLKDCLLEDDVVGLVALERQWRPKLRRRIIPLRKLSEMQRVVGDLTTSFQRFNRRWSGFVNAVRLGRVNALRADYNRYYLIEKECAVQSSRTAERGFQPLKPATLGELVELFPVLNVPNGGLGNHIA